MASEHPLSFSNININKNVKTISPARRRKRMASLKQYHLSSVGSGTEDESETNPTPLRPPPCFQQEKKLSSSSSSSSISASEYQNNTSQSHPRLSHSCWGVEPSSISLPIRRRGRNESRSLRYMFRKDDDPFLMAMKVCSKDEAREEGDATNLYNFPSKVVERWKQKRSFSLHRSSSFRGHDSPAEIEAYSDVEGLPSKALFSDVKNWSGKSVQPRELESCRISRSSETHRCSPVWNGSASTLNWRATRGEEEIQKGRERERERLLASPWRDPRVERKKGLEGKETKCAPLKVSVSCGHLFSHNPRVPPK